MHWINDQRVLAGNVLWNCPGGLPRGRELREVLGALGDVQGKCPDTVPEWQKRNLVTPPTTLLTKGNISTNEPPRSIRRVQYLRQWLI